MTFFGLRTTTFSILWTYTLACTTFLGGLYFGSGLGLGLGLGGGLGGGEGGGIFIAGRISVATFIGTSIGGGVSTLGDNSGDIAD